MKHEQKPQKRYQYWWIVGVLLVIAICIVVAIIFYRSSLEARDPGIAGDITINQSFPVIDIHICLPSSQVSSFEWTTKRIIPERTDHSDIMELSITTWGHCMLAMIGADDMSDDILEHCFLDHRGIAYIDFNGRFMDAFPLSTTTEMQLLASLFQTLESNVSLVRHITVLREGIPVSSWGGHLMIDPSHNPLLVESAG